MDEQLLRQVLYNPGLSKNDSVYILTILELQSRKERISHECVSTLLGDSIHTVRRSFKRLKKCGFLSSKRIGPTEWNYEVLMKADPTINDKTHYRLKNDPLKNDPIKNEQSQDTKYPYTYREYTNNSNNTLDVCNSNLSLVTNDCHDLTLPEGKRQLGRDPIGSYQSNIAFGFSLDICSENERKKSPMSLVAKPKDDVLGDTIVSALKKSESARHERHQRKQSQLRGETEVPSRYVAGVNKQLEAMKKKDIADYGCHEMWYIFRDAWNSRWKGKPKNWRGPEYKMVKDMLKEYPPKDVVGFIKYSLDNWDSIRVRHKSVAYPTFKIIYGLRGQIMAEYYNGPLAKIGEYSDEYNHIKDGEWG